MRNKYFQRPLFDQPGAFEHLLQRLARPSNSQGEPLVPQLTLELLHFSLKTRASP